MDKTNMTGDIISSNSANLQGAILKGEQRPDLIKDELLSEVFVATALVYPQKIALICRDKQFTYAQVNDLSDAIARGLMRVGIKAGDVVGLWMCRGADLLIAQIAITKTGAAWLPFDYDAPIDRIAICLQDAEAKGLLTSDTLAEKAAGADVAIFTASKLTDASDTHKVDARINGATPSTPAYMIYTSGSTGVPKGIVISQSNICHYLRSANTQLDVQNSDIVFQGASVAFDLSMEEIWIPYLVGATLWVATPDVMAEADRLADVLIEAGITVIDTVPTLLGILNKDVPSLRSIILGGEACPPALVTRWAKPNRKIFNTYGPTEATVVATLCEVKAGAPVTIGKPIPNYSAYVVDVDTLSVLPQGQQGELLIGGAGVAIGYLKRESLTTEKFIANPYLSDGSDPILYRSGDAVSIDANGEIAFHGRIDDQVKIRGFRVELGEIETKLSHEPNIAQVAVSLRKDNDLDNLVAFIVPEADTEIDTAALRTSLRAQLPPYMVPNRFEIIAELPRMISGKIDRKALKSRVLAVIDNTEAQEEPRNETEKTILTAAQKAFPGQALAFDADFFTELGGHSLIAAQFVSAVRLTPQFATLTMQDIYKHRTLRGIAASLDHAQSSGVGVSKNLSFTPPPFARRFLCGVAQAIALPFILGLVTIQWLGLFLASIVLHTENIGFWTEMGILMAIYVSINIAVKFLVIALKWLIIGRTKPGRYPLWGVYYFRVWLVQRLVQTVTMKFLQCSPMMRWYMRGLGAKIGRDAIISEFEAGAIDLISIGERASLGQKNQFANVEVIGNEMIIGTIEIGEEAYTGNSCVLSCNSKLERGAELGDLTALEPGTLVPAWEHWDGSPARKIGMVDRASLPDFPTISMVRRTCHACIYVVSYIITQMLGLLPIFPAFLVLYNLDGLLDGVQDNSVSWVTLPFLAWPTAMVLIVISMAVIVAVRWILLPRVRSGTFSIHSGFYLRKWVMGLASEVTLETLSSLYATVFMRVWYRMMGATIGKGTEISSNLAGRYDLIDLGKNNFVGDEVILGDEDIRNGYMTLNPVKTGDRVFFGNSAVVNGGAVIGDGALIGVKSKLPPSLQVGNDEIWFGSPAIKFPTRQRVAASAGMTYDPPAYMIYVRTIFETLHTSLPTAMMITCGYITADVIQGPLEEGNIWLTLGLFLASGVIIATILMVAVAIIKWVFMGRYKPTMYPMWSFWAMKTEMVAVLYGGLVGKAYIEFLRGTPFLPWVLRMYGCKIGKGCWLDLTDITEFDCVKIGDYCTFNMTGCLQTHLYEDRIMKVGRIEVGNGVYIGWNTSVLYDSKIGDYAQLGPLTLVMKGEHIPAHTTWSGAPAQPAATLSMERKVAA
jgi:non-ribosomal peptide synthetase-like protein